MSADFLNLAVLLSLCVCLARGMAVTDDMLEIKSVFGEDCTLPCTAVFKPGVQYRALRWYKVGEPPLLRLSGLLTRDLPNGTTRWYTGVEREVELLESHDIFLPNATCADSGVYTCHLAAPVGEQNREGRVLLTLTDCADSPTEDLVKDAYMVIIATAVLIIALIIFRISYVCLKNTLKEKNKEKKTKKETLLDARLKPLEKKDLMLIYTLGPKLSKTPTMKHVCV